MKFFYSTSQIFGKYNHLSDFSYNYGGLCCKIVCQFFGLVSVCYWVCLFLGWWLCLLLGLCVCHLGVRFGIGFVCLLVGSYVIMPFNSRGGVSVGLFY